MITDKCAEDKSDKDVAQGLDLLHSSADCCQKSTKFDSYALLKFNTFTSACYNVSSCKCMSFMSVERCL